jgi:hypothetical protein
MSDSNRTLLGGTRQMSRTEYCMAFKHTHREPGSRLVVDKDWMDHVAELAAEGWTIHSVDYKNNRCIMEREVDD